MSDLRTLETPAVVIDRPILEENIRAMQALAARFGAAFKSSFGEIEGRISLAWPGYDSLVNEAAAEGVALLATAFDAAPHSGGPVQPECS